MLPGGGSELTKPTSELLFYTFRGKARLNLIQSGVRGERCWRHHFGAMKPCLRRATGFPKIFAAL